ncbi:MAG: sugar kinase [Cloacibacterium sp.]|nr:sugar kinase [Cloacibacterium sp.]
MNPKICFFGEMLLRLSPNSDHWVTSNNIPCHLGGAELNTATALANWGIKTKYVTAVPDNFFSRQALCYFKEKNIDATDIVFSGDRLGLYYLPIGMDVKNATIVFDRKNSSFSQLTHSVFSWDNIFKGCSWYHFSTIVQSLNDTIAETSRESIQAALQSSVQISVDLNYRATLWNERNPLKIIPNLVQACDLIMGNIWSIEKLLGIPSPLENSEGKTISELLSAGNSVAEAIFKQYPKAKVIALTFRLDNEYIGFLKRRDTEYVFSHQKIKTVNDRVGSGDCFMAGLIYGENQKFSDQKIIDWATAAAINKLKEVGDTTSQTIADVENTISEKLQH